MRSAALPLPRRPTRVRPRPLVRARDLVFVVGLLVAAGVGVAASKPEAQRTVLLIALGLVTPAPLVVRAFQRRFDPFEPLTILSVSCFFIYFLRPLYSVLYHDYSYGPWDIRHGLVGGLLIALVGTTCLYAGYALGLGERLGRRIRPLPTRWDTKSTVHLCVGMLIVAFLLFSAYIAGAGGLGAAKAYFSARSLQAHQLADASSAYLYLAPYLTIPLALILLETYAGDRSRGVLVFGLSLVAFALVLTIPRGDRTYILALLLPLVALPYLRSGRRPRVWAIAALLIVSIIAINLLLANRVADQRNTPVVQAAANALTKPTGQIKKFMLGPDISMFSTLALTYDTIPKDMGFRPGNELESVLAGPVPGTIWPRKPHDGETYIFGLLFPSEASVIRAGNGPSILGGFYSDSGFVGVVVYSLIMGLGLRVLFEYWRANPRNAGVRLVYAACLPLVIILLRGSFADCLGRSVYLIGPCLLVVWWSRRGGRVREPAQD